MKTANFERQHTELVELATDLLQQAKATQQTDGGAQARQTLRDWPGR